MMDRLMEQDRLTCLYQYPKFRAYEKGRCFHHRPPKHRPIVLEQGLAGKQDRTWKTKINIKQGTETERDWSYLSIVHPLASTMELQLAHRSG